MKHKTLANGDVVFINNAPKMLQGFTKDKKDPNLFHPDFIDCDYRELRQYVKPCGKPGVYYWCSKLCKDVNFHICEACDVEPKECCTAMQEPKLEQETSSPVQEPPSIPKE